MTRFMCRSCECYFLVYRADHPEDMLHPGRVPKGEEPMGICPDCEDGFINDARCPCCKRCWNHNLEDWLIVHEPSEHDEDCAEWPEEVCPDCEGH